MIGFIGKGSPTFWFGIVENRNDPLKSGRVQVRLMGLHSENLNTNPKDADGIDVKELPWAYVGQSTESAAMQGIGESPTGMVEGTMVYGISIDGDLCQELLIMGVVPGINKTSPDRKKGFCDNNNTTDPGGRPRRPDDASGRYPKDPYIGEPDCNRLARNEKITDTIVQKKKDGTKKGIPEAQGGQWDEPQTPYNAQYPYNHVYESESGHIKEYDDTPGAERLHEYHRSGTFEEIYPDGTKVTKIVKDNYTLVIGNDFVNVAGNVSVTIEGNAQMYVNGNVTQKVDGNVNETVSGNVTRNVSGTYTVTSGGNMKFQAPKIDLN